MNVLFELSGEHATLPAAEAQTVLQAHNILFKARQPGRYLTVETDTSLALLRQIARCLALTHAVHQVHASGTVDDITAALPGLSFSGETFALRGHRANDSASVSHLKRVIGEAICHATGMTVDLDAPDVELHILVDDRVYLCTSIAGVDRSSYEQRKPHHRPFSHPISLHPRIARALVNLSGITLGETLLDPFCGTGGILIEAGLLGAHVVGVDVKARTIKGCRANLEHYGITDYTLHTADATTLALDEVDALVTDLPYGRSTVTGTDRDGLYRRAFERFADWLPPGRRAIVGVPEKRLAAPGEHFFDLVEVHPLYVHRSLTRYFCVFER
ncbi:MAG: methyltransferase domain-containing protein [Thermoplasmatota archaeon]